MSEAKDKSTDVDDGRMEQTESGEENRENIERQNTEGLKGRTQRRVFDILNRYRTIPERMLAEHATKYEWGKNELYTQERKKSLTSGNFWELGARKITRKTDGTEKAVVLLMQRDYSGFADWEDIPYEVEASKLDVAVQDAAAWETAKTHKMGEEKIKSAAAKAAVSEFVALNNISMPAELITAPSSLELTDETYDIIGKVPTHLRGAVAKLIVGKWDTRTQSYISIDVVPEREEQICRSDEEIKDARKTMEAVEADIGEQLRLGIPHAQERYRQLQAQRVMLQAEERARDSIKDPEETKPNRPILFEKPIPVNFRGKSEAILGSVWEGNKRGKLEEQFIVATWDTAKQTYSGRSIVPAWNIALDKNYLEKKVFASDDPESLRGDYTSFIKPVTFTRKDRRTPEVRQGIVDLEGNRIRIYIFDRETKEGTVFHLPADRAKEFLPEDESTDDEMTTHTKESPREASARHAAVMERQRNKTLTDNAPLAEERVAIFREILGETSGDTLRKTTAASRQEKRLFDTLTSDEQKNSAARIGVTGEPTTWNEEQKKKVKGAYLRERKATVNANGLRIFLEKRTQALADLRNIILQEVEFFDGRFNENVPSPRIEKHIALFQHRYGLSNPQIASIRSTMEELLERRTKASTWVEHYQKAHPKKKVRLLQELTGVTDLTMVDLSNIHTVSRGMCAVNITTADDDVFRKLYGKNITENTRGYCIPPQEDGYPYCTVVQIGKSMAHTQLHETQHALFEASITDPIVQERKDAFDTYKRMYDTLKNDERARYATTSDDDAENRKRGTERWKVLLRDAGYTALDREIAEKVLQYEEARREYLSSQQGKVLERAKDEILAKLRNNSLKTLQTHWESMFLREQKTNGERNPYYYLKGYNFDAVKNSVGGDLTEKQYKLLFGTDGRVAGTEKIGGYRGHIKSAINAIAQYMTRVRPTPNIEQVIAFFQPLDLRHWPSRVQKFLKGQNARS